MKGTHTPRLMFGNCCCTVKMFFLYFRLTHFHGFLNSFHFPEPIINRQWTVLNVQFRFKFFCLILSRENAFVLFLFGRKKLLFFPPSPSESVLPFSSLLLSHTHTQPENLIDYSQFSSCHFYQTFPLWEKLSQKSRSFSSRTRRRWGGRENGRGGRRWQCFCGWFHPGEFWFSG